MKTFSFLVVIFVVAISSAVFAEENGFAVTFQKHVKTPSYTWQVLLIELPADQPCSVSTSLTDPGIALVRHNEATMPAGLSLFELSIQGWGYHMLPASTLTFQSRKYGTKRYDFKAAKETGKNSMTIAINRKVYDDFFRYDSAKLRLIGKPVPGLNPQPKLGPWIIDLRGTVRVAEAMQECFDIQDTYGN